MLFMKKKKNKVLLEMPIQSKSYDSFNVQAYVSRLKSAIEQGAKFVAIDGEYGTGKSSIVNLLENELKRKNHIFIKINSLNINNENEFNRYFINKVAAQIINNPYEIEKMFYKQSFSYSSVNPISNNIWKSIVDKAMLIGFGFLFCNSIFKFLFENLFEEYKVLSTIDSFTPYIILILIVLILIYGYGFSKPEEDSISPILNVDKNRNNLFKILNTYVKKSSTLYFIIDDLDRLTGNCIQEKILTLLYNEYYPLDKAFKNIKFVFIFMIDLNKLQFTNLPTLKDNLYTSDENQNPIGFNNNLTNKKETIIIDKEKIFDFKIKISNNQNEILQVYFEDSIKDHQILNLIFGNTYSNDLENLVLAINNDIRKIKHFLNDVLNKYEYITSKKIENFKINYDQLVLICLLDNISKDSKNTLEIIDTLINNTNYETDNIFIKRIIAHLSKCLDDNYLIYIYNFIDHRNLLNLSELEIVKLLESYDGLHNYDTFLKIKLLFETNLIRSEKIYKKFKNSTTDKIMLLYSINHFTNYLKKENLYNLDCIDYQSIYIYEIANNFINNNIEEIDISLSLQSLIETEVVVDNILNQDYIDFINKFIDNVGLVILKMENISEIFDFKFSEELFNKLYNIKIEKSTLLFELYKNNTIYFKNISEWFTVDFIKSTKLNLIDLNLYEQILGERDNNDVFSYILSTTTNVENFYDNLDFSWNLSLLTCKDIILIINNFGYDYLIDNFIIQKFENNSLLQKELLDTICKKEYKLSTKILAFFNSIDFFYKFNDYYIRQFENNSLIKTLIKNDAIVENNIIKLYKSQYNTNKYKDAIFSIFFDTDYNVLKNFSFNKKVAKIIVEFITNENIHLISINKINYLISHLEIDDIKRVLTHLNPDYLKNLTKILLREDYLTVELLDHLYTLTDDKYIKSSISRKKKSIM